MCLPNFLIIGAAKSGTTSLWSYLRQHPDVYFSPYKEPNYFALAGESLPHPGPVAPEVLQHLIYSHCVTDLSQYSGLFSAATGKNAIGEASVRYLYYPQAARRIRDSLTDVRLVAILREPVSRLYSHYCMNVQYQLEPLALLDALEAEEDRKRKGWGWDWHYASVSRYSEQIQRYRELFRQDQLMVIAYDDFVTDPLSVFRQVCRHIGVDDTFTPNMSQREKAGTRPRNLTLDRWIHWPSATRSWLEARLPRRCVRAALQQIRRWNSSSIPKLSPELRREIAPRFKPEVKALEEILGRHLPWAA